MCVCVCVCVCVFEGGFKNLSPSHPSSPWRQHDIMGALREGQHGMGDDCGATW